MLLSGSRGFPMGNTFLEEWFDAKSILQTVMNGGADLSDDGDDANEEKAPGLQHGSARQCVRMPFEDDISGSELHQRVPGSVVSVGDTLRQHSAETDIPTLEQVIAAGDTEELKNVLSRKKPTDAALALLVLMGKFLKRNTHEWSCLMEDPSMFLAVIEQAQAYRPREAAEFIEAVNVHDRLRLVERAVKKGEASVVCNVMDLFPEQGADWLANERCRSHRYLLLDAVQSGKLDMFNEVLAMLGGKDEVISIHNETRRDGDDWIPRLLHAALVNGEVDIFKHAMEIFDQVFDESTPNAKWRLLDGAVKGGSLEKLHSVLECFFDEEAVRLLRDDPMAYKLFREAVRSKNVALVNKVLEISPQVMSQAQVNPTLLLEIALRGGDLEVFDRVADVMGITAVDTKFCLPLIRSAIRSGKVVFFDRVQQLMGEEMEGVLQDCGASFLKTAISCDNVALFDRLANMLKPEAMLAISERHGQSLLQCAVSGGDIILVRRVAGKLGAEMTKIATKRDAIIALECGIRSGSKALVEYAADAEADTDVDAAIVNEGLEFLARAIEIGDVALFDEVEKILRRKSFRFEDAGCSYRLLSTAVDSGNGVLLRRVAEVLGTTLSKVISKEDAGRLLKCAIRKGNSVIVKSVEEIIGEAAIKAAVRKGGTSFLEEAIRGGNVALVRHVAQILGYKAVDIMAQKDGRSLLEAAIENGNAAVFDRARKLVGDQAIKSIAAKHGVALFKNAIHSGDVTLISVVATSFGEQVVRTAFDAKGFQFLAFAIREGNMELVQYVNGFMAEKIELALRESPGNLQAHHGVVAGVVEYVLGTMGDKAEKAGLKGFRDSLLCRGDSNRTPVRGIHKEVTYQIGPARSAQPDTRRNRYISCIKRMVELVWKKEKEKETIPRDKGAFARSGTLIKEIVRETITKVVDGRGDLEGCSRRAFSMRDVYDPIYEYILDVIGDTGIEIRDSRISRRKRCFLKRAVCTGSRVLVDRAVEVMGEPVLKQTLRANRSLLLELAMWSGNVTLMERAGELTREMDIKIVPRTHGPSLLGSAIRGGDVTVVERMVDFLGNKALTNKVPWVEMLGAAIRGERVELFESVAQVMGNGGATLCGTENAVTLLKAAILSGNVTLLGCVVRYFKAEDLSTAVKAKGAFFLKGAISNGDVALVRRVVDLLEPAVKELVKGDIVSMCLYQIAVGITGGVGAFNELLKILSREHGNQRLVAAAITEKKWAITRWGEPAKDSILDAGLKACNVEVVRAALDQLNKGLPLWEVVKACTDSFRVAQTEVKPTDEARSCRHMRTLSLALQFGAVPGPEHLMGQIEHEKPCARWRKCFLDAVCSAPNPFIPGMHILATLDEVAILSAEGTTQGAQEARESLWQDISEVLVGILEKLPKSVDACPGNMKTCSMLFEPKTENTSLTGFSGPLGITLSHRRTMEKFCAKSLVADFMSHKFHGSHLEGVDDEEFPLELRILFACDKYYLVPKLRMAFDLEVYLAVLIFFTLVVLVEGEGRPGLGEISFVLYLAGALMTEAHEIWRDAQAYFRDRWNVLDLPANGLLLAGWIFRMADNDNIWGKGLYALGAPLLYSRILHFTQILPFQGPMIQVISSMTRVLLQFALVLLVILFGFTASLFALYRHDLDYTYGKAMLALFKAILGDVDLFDDIAGTEYPKAATVLLVVYLVVMTIMLLNLLIAVLSTAYSSVHDNIAVEYNVSRARIIRHYVLVVKNDLLPAPFNLLQLPLWSLHWIISLFSKQTANDFCEWAKRGVGIAVFYVCLGPVVVVFGSLRALTGVWLYNTVKQNSKSGKIWSLGPIKIAFNFPVVTPFLLVVLWVVGGVECAARYLHSFCDRSEKNNEASLLGEPAHDSEQKHVTRMLKNSLGGLSVAQLQRYLDDPMSDSVVRPDEGSKGTMVEHLKLLRNCLQDSYAAETRNLERRVEQLDARVGDLEDVLEAIATRS